MSDCQRAVDEVKGKEANRKEFHKNATNLYYFKCNQKIELFPCFHPANLLLSNCHRVPQAFVVFLKSELDLFGFGFEKM